MCHSKLLLHMRQASNIVLIPYSCQSVYISSRSSSLHMSLFSFSVLKLQQYPQFNICDSVTVIAWILTKAEKFGYKHLRAHINYLEW